VGLAPLFVSVLLSLSGRTLHVFSPWAGSIPARGVTIDKTFKGRCTHGSEVLTRFDA